MNIYDDTPETTPKVSTPITARAAAIRTIRSSAEYRRRRNQYRKQTANHHNPDGSKGQPCWLCNGPIDYRLKHPHPRSWTLDHAIPITDNPNHLLDPNNFRPAHLDCNNQRGAGQPRIELGQPSEIW
jgi:5-methylcytosine-specific restriction endonuclease McrA